MRDKHVLTLQNAIHKMSGMPAARLTFNDRGLLRPGMKADIVVFDPAAVADKATFDQPHQYSVGFKHVVVNGKLVLKDERVTAERPGRVIRGPAYVGP